MIVKQERSRKPLRTWLRHVNKVSFNRLTLAFAGRHLFAAVRHVGRRSGRAYTTPVVAWPLPDGFLMPLPYGTDTDWCRNVLAAAHGTIEWHGRTYIVTWPEVIDATTAQALLPTGARRLLQVVRVRHFLKVYRLAAQEGTSSRDRE